MIAKLKEIIGFQLRPDQCNMKVDQILDVVINYLKNNEVNRTEVRHTSVNEIIPKIYKMKNELLCEPFDEKEIF